MDKIKKIIISLSIALVCLFVLNYFIIKSTNSQYIEVSVFKVDALKGNKINNQDITTIQVKKTDTNKYLLENIVELPAFGKILTKDVFKGEIVRNEDFANEDEILEYSEQYRYISIPITDISYPTCNKLKKGDKVTIYYTAKSKDVSEAIKDKERIYSNTTIDGLVTCLLFENVEVISIHDSTGQESKESLITDLLVRLEKEQIMLVSNLKTQGTFDIVLN